MSETRIVVDGVTYIAASTEPIVAAPVTARAAAPVAFTALVAASRKTPTASPYQSVPCAYIERDEDGAIIGGCAERFRANGRGMYDHTLCEAANAIRALLRKAQPGVKASELDWSGVIATGGDSAKLEAYFGL